MSEVDLELCWKFRMESLPKWLTASGCWLFLLRVSSYMIDGVLNAPLLIVIYSFLWLFILVVTAILILRSHLLLVQITIIQNSTLPSLALKLLCWLLEVKADRFTYFVIVGLSHVNIFLVFKPVSWFKLRIDELVSTWD